jgi:hypothetical protein
MNGGYSAGMIADVARWRQWAEEAVSGFRERIERICASALSLARWASGLTPLLIF